MSEAAAKELKLPPKVSGEKPGFFDFVGLAKWMVVIRPIVWRDLFQQFAGIGAHDGQNAFGSGYIHDDGVEI